MGGGASVEDQFVEGVQGRLLALLVLRHLIPRILGVGVEGDSESVAEEDPCCACRAVGGAEGRIPCRSWR